MKILLFIFITGWLVACQSGQHSQQKVEQVKYTKSSLNSLRELTESIEVIRLERNNNILIGDPVVIRHRDSSFYIADLGGTMSIFRYSETGLFRDSIGKKGKGPGEYEQLVDFFVDENSNNIYTCSYPDFRLYNYDKTGQFKNMKTAPLGAGSFIKTDKGYWLYPGINNGYQPEQVTSIDTNLNITGKFLPLETKTIHISSGPVFSEYPGHIFLTMPFCPVIYEISADTLTPVLEFDFGEYNISESYWNASDPMQAFADLQNKGFTYIRHLTVNDNYFIVEINEQKGMSETETLYYCAIKNRKSGKWDWIRQQADEKGLVTNNEKAGIAQQTADWYANRIQDFTKDGRLICSLPAHLLDLLQPEDKALIQNPELLENANPDTDMFLLLIKLKNH